MRKILLTILFYLLVSGQNPDTPTNEVDINKIETNILNNLKKYKKKFSEGFKLDAQFLICEQDGRNSCRGDIGSEFPSLSPSEIKELYNIELGIINDMYLYYGTFSSSSIDYVEKYFCNFKEMNFGCTSVIVGSGNLNTTTTKPTYIFPYNTYSFSVGFTIAMIFLLLFGLLLVCICHEFFLSKITMKQSDIREEENITRETSSFKHNLKPSQELEDLEA